MAPLSPWQRLVQSIRQNGFLGFHRQILRHNDAVASVRRVGEDHTGNVYYEALPGTSHSGRERSVDYGQWDFNGSQVPPEWHAWLNGIRKDPPHEDPIMQQSHQKWMQTSWENLTGTRGAYKSYSTTAPKLLAWEPKVTPRQ